MKIHNNRLHADAQTYAAFVGFAALHFTTKASPVWALVSRALGENAIKTLLKVICFLLLPAITHADDQESMKKDESMKFGMQAVLTAAEGKGKELADIMLQASRAVSTLEGCELYIVQTSLTDESKILITEVWESKEAHQGSLANEKVRELIGKAKPIIVGMEHHPATFVGGHGLQPGSS